MYKFRCKFEHVHWSMFIFMTVDLLYSFIVTVLQIPYSHICKRRARKENIHCGNPNNDLKKIQDVCEKKQSCKVNVKCYIIN